MEMQQPQLPTLPVKHAEPGTCSWGDALSGVSECRASANQRWRERRGDGVAVYEHELQSFGADVRASSSTPGWVSSMFGIFERKGILAV